MLLDCTEVLPKRLWVGGYLRPRDVERLKHWRITTVINLQSDDDLSDFGISISEITRACAAAGIDFRRVPITDFDREALAARLAKSVEEVESVLLRPEARVYLHCTAGINRAPTVAAAFLMRSHGKSASEAYEFLTACRRCRPYLSILEEYAASLKNSR